MLSNTWHSEKLRGIELNLTDDTITSYSALEEKAKDPFLKYLSLNGS